MEQNEHINKRQGTSTKSISLIKSNVSSNSKWHAKGNRRKMIKMYKDFVWDGKKRGQMSWDQIINPRIKGGLGIPDLKSRIEAIEVMWIKRWLNPKETRPKWAYILDMIINKNTAKEPIVEEASRINWLLQSWNESEAKGNKVSENIRRMLKIARKYNITAIAQKYNKKIKEDQPLWHNILVRATAELDLTKI